MEMAPKNESLNKYDVIVLGAGLSGLSCASELLIKSSKKVLILEKEKNIGGLAATFKYKNFKYDLSPHRWYTKNSFLNKWLKDLLGEDLITVKRYTPIYQFNKLFNYPIELFDVINKVGFFKSILIVVSYLKSKIFKKEIINMKDAYISRFGLELYKSFNEEYNDKLWGKGSCEKMSADFVDQRVKNLSVFSILLEAFRIKRKNVISLISKFEYPKFGIGQISDKLLEKIIDNGGEIKFEEKILRIKKYKTLYKIFTKDNIYTCQYIVSSIPIVIFLKYFSKLDKKIENNLNKLKYIKQKIVVLFVKSKKITNFTWVYIHPKKILSFRFMEMNNWSKFLSPSGYTSLIFEYPFLKNSEIEKLDDKELIKKTVNDFEKIFNNNKKIELVSSIVHVVDHAYPVYNLNYKKHLEKVKKYISKLKNVQIIGRNGMFRYNNMDHSVLTGIYAAENIINPSKKINLELINNEAEYLEEIKK